MSNILIIQSGGKATRMEQYPSNLPKCLQTLGSKTFLEHQLDLYKPDDVFIILDESQELWRPYLESLFNVKTFITTKKGDLAGIQDLMNILSDEDKLDQFFDLSFYDSSNVTITWSDVLLPNINITALEESNFILLSDNSDKSRIHLEDNGFFGVIKFDLSIYQSNLNTLFEDSSKVTPTFITKLADILSPKVIKDEEILYLGTRDELIEAAAKQKFVGHSEADIKFDSESKVVSKTSTQEDVDTFLSFMSEAYPQIHCFKDDWHLYMPFLERPKTITYEEGLEEIERLHSLKPLLLCSSEYIQSYLEDHLTYKTVKNIQRVLGTYPIWRHMFLNKFIDPINSHVSLNHINYYTKKLISFLRQKDIFLKNRQLVFTHGDPTLSNLYKHEGQLIFLDSKTNLDVSNYFIDSYDKAKWFYSFHGMYDQMMKVDSNEAFVVFNNKKNEDIYIHNPYIIPTEELNNFTTRFESFKEDDTQFTISMLFLPIFFFSLAGLKRSSPKQCLIALSAGYYYYNKFRNLL